MRSDDEEENLSLLFFYIRVIILTKRQTECSLNRRSWSWKFEEVCYFLAENNGRFMLRSRYFNYSRSRELSLGRRPLFLTCELFAYRCEKGKRSENKEKRENRAALLPIFQADGNGGLGGRENRKSLVWPSKRTSFRAHDKT